jgi:hypothetical protein
MADAKLKVRIDAETRELQNGLKKADQDLKSFSNKANGSLSSLSSNASIAMKGAAASIAGAFSIGAIVGFTKKVFNATAEFQKFEAVLGNTLGSSALANLKLKEIQEFAARTPFSVNELTASFVKLANAGFKPTGDEMTRLGDLASSTGKSFDQLAEAILDAQTGEFERLKEFGVRAQDAGDKVIFTFKGVKTEVDKSSSAIRNYVTSLGAAEGVSGSMAVISATLTGKISNLGDSWDQMLISIGSNTSGVFSSAIDIISKGINKITEFNKELEIQSKYNIGGSFLKRLTSSTEFNGIDISNNEKAVKTIIELDKEINQFVSNAILGAKKVSDFGVAIAKLKSEGDKKLTESSILGKEAQFGIKDTFENAIKALIDGRKTFLVEINKAADAGFGKVKETKELKSVNDILKELETNFKKISASVDITFGDANKQKISAIGGAIDRLIESGVEGDNPIIKRLQNQILDLKPENLDKSGNLKNVATIVGKQINQTISGALTGGTITQVDIAPKLIKPFDEWGNYVNQTLLPSLQGSFQTFFDEILKNGTFSFQSLGSAILKTLGSVLASETAKGFLGLFKVSQGQDFTDAKKEGGLFNVLLGAGGLFGKKAAAGATAKTAGAAAGGSLLLPILGGLAAGGIIASLFKKKEKAPAPAVSTTTTSSSLSSSADFGGGSVVFQISGTNLIGVLNRAGAKLQRYGG